MGARLALGGQARWLLCPHFIPTLAEASTLREATVHLQDSEITTASSIGRHKTILVGRRVGGIPGKGAQPV